MSLVTLEEFKTYLSVTRDTDLADDDALQAALDSADASICSATDRNLVLASGPATDREFVATRSATLKIDDCTTVTVIDDNGTVLTTDYYRLEPVNGQEGGQYRPYSEIRRSGGWWCPYDGLTTVTVTATWGWATIPAPVLSAAKILAKDIAKTADISFGIAGFTDYAGVRARENPMVWQLLLPFRKSTGIA